MSRSTSYDFNLLRALEVFLAVAEYGQMTRAAATLGITQSAVSQHLSNLESSYDTILIDRKLKPIGLTLTGLALQQHAQQILRKVETVNGDLQQLEHKQFPILRIGILPSIATLLTPMLIEQAREHFQVQHVSLYADLANRHDQLLKNRQLDMVITSSAFYDMDGLSRHPILEEQFLLVLPAGTSKVDSLIELNQHLPFIRFAETTPAGKLIDQHLRRCRVDIERVIEADRTTMLMASVAAGLGFAILSPTLLLDGITEGMQLTIQPLPLQPLSRSLILVSRNLELDDMSKQFSSNVRDILKAAVTQKLDEDCQQAVRFTTALDS